MKVLDFLKDIEKVAEVEKKRSRYRYKVKKGDIDIYKYYNFLRTKLKLPVTCVYQGEYRWLQVPFKVLDVEISERELSEWFKDFNKEKVKSVVDDKIEKKIDEKDKNVVSKENRSVVKGKEVEEKHKEEEKSYEKIIEDKDKSIKTNETTDMKIGEVKMKIARKVTEACINCVYISENPKGYLCKKWNVVFNIASVYTCDEFQPK